MNPQDTQKKSEPLELVPQVRKVVVGVALPQILLPAMCLTTSVTHRSIVGVPKRIENSESHPKIEGLKGTTSTVSPPKT